jgi:hypothetical protein
MDFCYICKIIFIIFLILGIIFIFLPCTSQKKENYESNHKLKNKMKNYNVIFAGCCRSVEPYLKKILDHIEICGKKFNDYSVIIYENDSIDKTRQILNENKLIF